MSGLNARCPNCRADGPTADIGKTCPYCGQADYVSRLATVRLVKQVIVIRRDLGMRRGKEIAQGSHAAMAFLAQRFRDYARHGGFAKLTSYNQYQLDWLSGLQTKVVCQVANEIELLDVYQRARDVGLETHLIEDAAFTEFKHPTHTAVAIGPEYAEDIDKITGSLKLY